MTKLSNEFGLKLWQSWDKNEFKKTGIVQVNKKIEDVTGYDQPRSEGTRKITGRITFYKTKSRG